MNTFSSEQHVGLGFWNGTKRSLRTMRFSLLSILVAVLGLVFVAGACDAQDNAAPAFNDVSGQTQAPIPGAGHDYQHLLGETVNYSNGSVDLKISFPVAKGRGITLPYAWSYNSALVNPLNMMDGNQPAWDYKPSQSGPVVDGWNTMDGIPYASVSVWSYAPPNNRYQQFAACNVQSGMTFTDPSGVMHDLYVSAQASSNTNSPYVQVCGTQGYVPAGGDGQVVAKPDPNTAVNHLAGGEPSSGGFVVIDKNGTTYSFGGGAGPANQPTTLNGGGIEDKNGNQITYPGPGNALWVDTAGRTGPVVNGTTVVADGLTYTPTWGTTGAEYTISLASVGLPNTGAGVGCVNGSIPTTVSSDTHTSLTSLTMPNGQKYQFFYSNIYGLLSEIIYPDGGWVKYTWQLPSGENEIAFWAGEQLLTAEDGSTYYAPVNNGCGAAYQTPVLATRTVSYDGTTIAQTQNFTLTTSWPSSGITTWNQKTTTVATTDYKTGLTSTTVYTYTPYSPTPQNFASGAIAPSIPLESEVQYYDWGQAPPATPAKTVTKTWLDQFNMTSETTTIAAAGVSGGEVSGTVYKYVTGIGGSSSSSSLVYLAEQDDYDYGNGALQAHPIRKTFYNYTNPESMPTSVTAFQLYTSSTDEFPMTLPPHVSNTIVESVSSSGTATIQAATQYAYDGTTLSSATATQHDSSYGTSMLARGNLTSATRCTTLPTTTSGSCSVGPTTTYNYDITGQPASMTDANGNQTTFSFADSFTDDSSAPSTNAYLTNITYPSTNGVAHQENFFYSYWLGYLTKSKNENGALTSYVYNTPPSGCSTPDGMNRLSQVNYPDGGETTYCYNDTAVSETTSTLINSTAGLWKTSVTQMDGMAHPIETQLTSDVNVDVVNTTYDGEGHVMTVTNPHWTTSTLPTDGITTNYYDGFGRKIESVEPDGNKVQTCYNGLTSTPAVSNCNARLGTAATGTWVDSADEAGNDWQQTTDGLGRMTVAMEPNGTTKTPSMETDYPYDVLNNLLSVTQTGNTAVDTPRTSRSFTYNNLGQLVTSFNPESGTERYTYDLNGNLVTRTSPLVNATSGSATQTLGYCYDTLNRVTYKFYTGSPNCASPSGYVASFSYDTSSVSGAYLDIGRLTSESAYVNGTLTSVRTPYQYDSMGRLLAEQQTPYNPNSAVYQFLNTYDQAGDMTSTTNGFAAGNANAYSTSYTYDGAQRLSTLTAGSNCTSGTCTPFAQTVLYTATNYGPAGITAAAYPAVANGSGGLKLTRLYDNKLRVVDHQVYTNGDQLAQGTITITGTLASGDSGSVKITLGGVELSAPYSATTNTTPAMIASALIAAINQSPEVIATCPNTPCWAKVTAVEGSSSNIIALTAILEGTTGDVAITATTTTTPSFTVATSGSNLTGGSGNEVYYYQLAYNANGNIHSSTDSVNSQYGYSYDTLNRITETAGNGQGASAPGGTYDFQCWAYDGFGNRTNEADTNNGCASFAPTGSNYTTQTAYTTGNRVSSTTVQSAVGTYLYDLAGNVINDGVNQYVYDLDGRICAVWSNYASSGAMTQYVYDAEGRRVGKGTITAWPTAGATCAAPAGSGFTLTSVYLRGVSGDQDTELDGSLALQHTNIYAGAGVMASYWNSGTDAAPAFKLSYIYNDWLGTKRRQESSAGVTETSWKSDPFGDYMTPAIGAVNSEANEMHLTGKERDKESGNDYFGARYYNSPMGRFMSPDWSAKEDPVPYAKLSNPQTLNLYAFVGNNPISHVDVDGHQEPGPDRFGCSEDQIGCDGRKDPAQQDQQKQKQQQNSTAEAQQQILGQLKNFNQIVDARVNDIISSVQNGHYILSPDVADAAKNVLNPPGSLPNEQVESAGGARGYLQNVVGKELTAQIGRETSSLLGGMNSDQRNGFYVALQKQDRALAPGQGARLAGDALGYGIGKIPYVGSVLNFLIAHTGSNAQSAHDNTMNQIQTSIGLQ